MATMRQVDPAVTLWDHALRPVWVTRLVTLGIRDGGDPTLVRAWRELAVAAQVSGWTVRAIVPLWGDPAGHQWLVLARRGASGDTEARVAHGATAAQALYRLALMLAEVAPASGTKRRGRDV